MKLNPDCIRDTLLYLETELQIDSTRGKFKKIPLGKIQEHFEEKYSKDDIWYSVYNLKEIRYIDGTFQDSSSSVMYICNISNITWSGHEFLNSVRPKTVWDATKNGAKKLGLMSISALNMIASEITKAIVTNPTLINNIVSSIKF